MRLIQHAPTGLRSILARLLLGLMLVVAQQGALLHALGHGFEHFKQDSSPQVPEKHDCCAAFHGLDHAVATAAALPQADPAPVASFLEIPPGALPAFHAHFRSRAPPAIS